MTKIAAPPFEPDIKVEVRNLYKEGAHGTMRETCRWTGVDETTFSKQLSPRQPDYHPVIFEFLTELFGDRRADKKFPGSNIVQKKLMLVQRVVRSWDLEESDAEVQHIEDLRDKAYNALSDLARDLWPGAPQNGKLRERVSTTIEILRDLESAEALRERESSFQPVEGNG